MPIPDYQSLMLPVLIASSNGEVGNKEVVERLSDESGLTLEERSALLPSGKQATFSNRVNWAKSYLGKACLITATRRGYFKITERGTTLLSTCPTKINNKVLKQFEEFRQFTKGQLALTTPPMSSLRPPPKTKSKLRMNR